MHKNTLMTIALVAGAWALPACDKGEASTTIGLPMGNAGTDGGNADDDDDDTPDDDDDDDDDDRPNDDDDDDDDDDVPPGDDDDDNDDDDDTGGSSPGMDSPCCMAQDGPGCAADPDVEACICEVDSFCCEDSWDDLCAAMINVEGCGMCAEDPGGTGGPDLPDEPSDCCTPSSMPGCTMPEVEACVCAQDEFCCSDQWDFVCIAEVNEYECGIMCDVPDPGGDLPDEPSDCCTPTAQPGCTDMAIESCVCEQDEFCCMTNWDALCVDEVAEFMCGACPA